MKKNDVKYKKVLTIKDLDLMFPFLLSLSGFEHEESDKFLDGIKENYEYFAVSIFQKGLQENDYSNPNILTHYQQIFSSKRKDKLNKIKQYKNIKKSFIFFFQKIYSYGLYTHDHQNYVTLINNFSYLLRCVKDGLKEKKFKNYVIPTLGITLSSSFDFTLYVYANKNNYKKDEFEKIVKDSGLYILR